jgi:hypothetical protein
MKSFVELTIRLILLGLALVTLGAGPPPPTATPPASEAEAESFSSQPATAVLDLTTATVIPLSSFEIASEPVLTHSLPSIPMIMAEYDGQALKLTTEARELEELAGERGSRNTTVIVSENFEAAVSPLWKLYDNNGPTGGVYSWGIEACFSTAGLSPGDLGSRSIWVAGTAQGSPSLSPCHPTNAHYPARLDAWVVYGPFSLEDAKSAWFDFYYWLDNADDPNDKLFWGVSIDADKNNPFAPATFHGQTVSGVYNRGPFSNNSSGDRYNLVSVDLTQVPTLGNVTGRPEVWIGFRFLSDGDGVTGRGAFIDSVSIRKNMGTQRKIVIEDFETTFPAGYESWLSHDNNGSNGGNYRWGSANCHALSGTKSIWVARDNGTSGGLNPCQGVPLYPAGPLDSWLKYGPFSLEGADEASLDFYFRNSSQPIAGNDPDTGDLFFWWASIDNIHFYGPGVSSTVTGAYGNSDYNQMRFDLSRVPGLGDIRGQPTVWIAFVFRSNGDTQVGEGAFVDDVSITVIGNRAYLPILIKSEPVPVGGITFSNFTKNPLVIELVGFGTRTFPGTTGTHVWDNIPAGTYDWVASGNCPAGQGQVGSLPPSNRQKVTIIANKLNNPINVENGGKFDCSG